MLILEIDEELGLDVVVVNATEFAMVEEKNVLGSKTESQVIITLLARAAALQSVAVRRSTGNDVVATISAIIFHFTIFSPPSRPFLIEGVLGSKNLFSESGSKWPIT